MNAPSNLVRWFAAAVVLAASGVLGLAEEVAAAPPLVETTLRTAVTQSLSFLTKGGDQWIEDKNCNSCHHLPHMLWSHREARRRGLAVDQAKADEWLAWAQPKVPGIAAGREQVAFMLLARALPEAATAEAEKIILAGVEKDHTWKPAAQFTAQRRPTAEAQLNSMRIFLLALASGSATGRKAAEEARTNAAGWMTQQAAKPAQSTETVAFQAWYAQTFGLVEERAAALALLLKHQRADGGWSWMLGDAQSDALATGEVLYVLHQLGAAEGQQAHAIARGQQWLVRTQAADGSWPIQVTYYSKNDRNTPEKAASLKQATGIYTYWAAAWGTLGLLHGLPVKDVAAQ